MKAMPNQPRPLPPRGFRSSPFLLWVRRFHAWVGLGGAAFGLLFGLTGFLMNHRSVLRIEAGQIRETRVPVELPEPLPGTPETLARFLAERFGIPMARVKWRVQPGRAGRLGSAPVKTPDQWVITFQGHRRFATAAYIPGNRTVELEQREADLLQVLKRLHKGDGGQLGWILLTDAFAGSLVFLTLSGTLLWTRLDGPRLRAVALALGGLLLALGVALRGL